MDDLTFQYGLLIMQSRQREPTEHERELKLWIDRFDHSQEKRHKRLRLKQKAQYGFNQVLSGRGRFFSPPTGWVDVTPGDCFFTFPDVPHYYDAITEWHQRWLIFDGTMPETFRTMGLLNPEGAVHRDMGQLADTVFLKVQENTTLESSARATANLAAISELIYRAATQTTTPHAQRDKVRPVMAYIRENYARELIPEQLADLFDISYSYLRCIFKKRTGRSVKQYITHVRMQQARTLLLDTELPPKQIARRVGYRDYLYFMRVFKRETGMTAGDVRHGGA